MFDPRCKLCPWLPSPWCASVRCMPIPPNPTSNSITKQSAKQYMLGIRGCSDYECMTNARKGKKLHRIMLLHLRYEQQKRRHVVHTEPSGQQLVLSKNSDSHPCTSHPLEGHKWSVLNPKATKLCAFQKFVSPSPFESSIRARQGLCEQIIRCHPIKVLLVSLAFQMAYSLVWAQVMTKR